MTDDTTRMPERPAPLPELVQAAHAGRRRRTRRNVALAAGALVLVGAAGVAGQQVLPGGTERSTDRIADTAPDASCDKQDPQPPSEPVPSGSDYPRNASGQTYGSARDTSRQPDLVAAVGDCGRTGYIERDALSEQPRGSRVRALSACAPRRSTSPTGSPASTPSRSPPAPRSPTE